MKRLFLLAMLLACLPASGARYHGGSPSAPPVGQFGVAAQGTYLVSTLDGSKVQMRGVNQSGLEGTPFLNDPWVGMGAPNTVNMAANWSVNVLRLPLSEANWLGLCSATLANGVTPTIYQNTIAAAVASANAQGIYVILDLHWIAIPNSCPSGQNAMADTTYSQTFWEQVATLYKNNPAVIFELFNEPQGAVPPTSTSFGLYLNGGLSGPQDIGINTLISAIRAEGATNLILVDCTNFALDCTDWQNPTDSGNNYAAVLHYYNGSSQEAATNLILKGNIPVVVTEYGDNVNKTSDPVTTSLYGWADPGGRAAAYITSQGGDGAHFPGVSYVSWTWNWGLNWYPGGGPGSYNNWSIIQNNAGTIFYPAACNGASGAGCDGDTSTTPTQYAGDVQTHYICRNNATC